MKIPSSMRSKLPNSRTPAFWQLRGISGPKRMRPPERFSGGRQNYGKPCVSRLGAAALPAAFQTGDIAAVLFVRIDRALVPAAARRTIGCPHFLLELGHFLDLFLARLA